MQTLKTSKNNQKILIVGAGVMGLCVAEALARAMPDIAMSLADPKGVPAMGSASMLAAGMISPYYELDHLPASYLSAGMASIEFWQRMGRDKLDTGFRRTGSLLIAHAQDRHMVDRFSTLLSRLDLSPESWRKVNGPDIQKLEPSLTGFESGLYMPEEAHLHAPEALRILTKTLSSCFITQNVDIEDSARDYDIVLDCRGYGAQEDDPDLRGVKGEILCVRNTEFHLSRPVRLAHPRYPLYIVPREAGEFVIGATVIESGGETHVSLRSGMELMSALYSLHPSFGEAQILSLSAGIRPAYADNFPRVSVDRNIIRCNGLFRHGFLLAPAMAECVVSMVRGTDHIFMDLFRKEKRDEHHLKRRRSNA
jgi:glycine oxidase